MATVLLKSKANNYEGVETSFRLANKLSEFEEVYYGAKYTEWGIETNQSEKIIRFIFKNNEKESFKTKCELTVFDFDCENLNQAKKCFENLLSSTSYWRYSYGTDNFQNIFARFEKMGFPILYLNENKKLTCIEIGSHELSEDEKKKILWLGQDTTSESLLRNTSDYNEFEIGYELEKTDLYSLAEILDYSSTYSCFFAHDDVEETKVEMEWLWGFTKLTGGKKDVSFFYVGSESITAEEAAEMLRLTKNGKINFIPTGLFIKKLNNGFLLKRKLGPQFILKVEGSRFIFDPRRGVLKTISEKEFIRLGKLIDKLSSDNWNATSYTYAECESVETKFKS